MPVKLQGSGTLSLPAYDDMNAMVESTAPITKLPERTQQEIRKAFGMGDSQQSISIYSSNLPQTETQSLQESGAKSSSQKKDKSGVS